MSVDSDVWTCPRCNGTVRGTSKRRRDAQRDHARRHGDTPRPLDIPPASRSPQRRR